MIYLERRLQKLETAFGGSGKDGHPDCLKDEAQLAAAKIQPGEAPQNIPEPLRKAHSRQSRRADLIRFGGMAEEEVRKLSNEQLDETYWRNRGILERHILCMEMLLQLYPDPSHEAHPDELFRPLCVIANYIQDNPQLGLTCPPEMVELAHNHNIDCNIG